MEIEYWIVSGGFDSGKSKTFYTENEAVDEFHRITKDEWVQNASLVYHKVLKNYSYQH